MKLEKTFVFRLCLLGLPLVVGASLVGPVPARAQTALLPQAQERIRALQDRLKKTDSDSLRYELALAYRDSGTIEDRYRALELFDLIRSSFNTTPRYHWDRAILFEKSGRPSNASSSLEEVLKLTPEDVAARVEIARLRIKELLYRYDLGGTETVVQGLRDALAYDPECRDALFLMSLTYHLAKWAPGSDVPSLTLVGKACLERILTKDPRNVSALFLLGVHCLDLDQVEEAERHFTDGLAASPEETRAAFASIRWTAPPSALSHAHDLDSKQEALFDQAYWLHDDPTPLTRINENQLEIWKRMAVAEFLFGTKEVHGWETDPGEAFIRYGPPRGSHFDPGSVTAGNPEQGDAPEDAGDMSRFKFNLKFIHPSWRWDYSFHDLDFSLTFEDLNLQGDFVKSERSAMTVQVLRSSAPVVFLEAPSGEIQNLYLATAGVAGPEGKVHQSLYVGLPPWRKPKGDDWFLHSRLELVLRDSTYAQVGHGAQRVSAQNLYRPLEGAELLLFTSEYDLVPGRYTLTAYVEDEDTKKHGVFSRPFEVRDYRRAETLQISDLELALRTGPNVTGPKRTKLGQTYVPNPMGWVGDLRNLEVFYELYGLATTSGAARFSTRYTVVPRAYVLGYEYFVRLGKAEAQDLVLYAADGLSIAGLSLNRSNYSDTEFPEESMRIPGRGLPRAIVLDLSALAPGEYVLIVTVNDLVSQEHVSARTLFQVLTDLTMREVLTYRD